MNLSSVSVSVSSSGLRWVSAQEVSAQASASRPWERYAKIRPSAGRWAAAFHAPKPVHLVGGNDGRDAINASDEMHAVRNEQFGEGTLDWVVSYAVAFHRMKYCRILVHLRGARCRAALLRCRAVACPLSMVKPPVLSQTTSHELKPIRLPHIQYSYNSDHLTCRGAGGITISIPLDLYQVSAPSRPWPSPSSLKFRAPNRVEWGFRRRDTATPIPGSALRLTRQTKRNGERGAGVKSGDRREGTRPLNTTREAAVVAAHLWIGLERFVSLPIEE
jgi:hypothetical protein